MWHNLLFTLAYTNDFALTSAASILDKDARRCEVKEFGENDTYAISQKLLVVLDCWQTVLYSYQESQP